MKIFDKFKHPALLFHFGLADCRMPCRRWQATRLSCHNETAAPAVRAGSGISSLGFQRG